MTRANLQKRSALHRRRGFHLGRAEPLLPLAPDPQPPHPDHKPPIPATPAPNTSPATATSASTAATATPAKAKDPLVPSIISDILPPVLKSSSTTTSASSTTSSTSSSVTSSRTTSSSLPKASSLPTTVPAAPHVVVQTATSVSLASSQTPSQSAQPASGMSAITVIGGIGGALAATLLLTVLIGFLLRRWRKRKSAEFDPDHFRRSAVLIEENENDEKAPSGPRPPSMFERRNAPSPPAIYPYSDEQQSEYSPTFAQHGANQGQYGPAILRQPSFTNGNQMGGAPPMHYGAHSYAGQDLFANYSGQGQGAPPIPGVHGPGAYAPYGVDPRYPQSQRYPHPQQYHNQQSQQQLQRGPSVSSIPNPFSSNPASRPLGLTEDSIPELPTSPAPTSTSPPLPSGTPLLSPNPGTTSFVTRQSHETPPAYTNNGGYADVQRDVKVAPSSELNIMNQGSNQTSDTAAPKEATRAAGTPATPREPSRPRTVYDDDDVYGGM